MNQDLKQCAQLHDENIEAIKIAVKLSEHLEAKEQAMFIAVFEECLKWQADQDKKEIERLKGEITARVLLIKSEPDGIVRESMINNLLIDL